MRGKEERVCSIWDTVALAEIVRVERAGKRRAKLRRLRGEEHVFGHLTSHSPLFS